MFSLFKYLNIIQLSDFSLINSLINKYIKGNVYNRIIELYYLYSVQENYNYNRSIIKLILEKDNVRILNPNIKLKTLVGESMDIVSYTEFNCFYTYVYKNTTAISHDIYSFLKTITNNNKKVSSSSYKQSKYVLNSDNIEYDQKFISNQALESSLILYRVELETLGRLRLVNPDLILGYYKKKIFAKYESTFLTARKCMSLKTFVSNDLKTDKNLMINETQDFISNYFKDGELVDPLSIYNKVMFLIQTNSKIGNVNMKDIARYCILSKKEQYESSREIYELNIFGKVLASNIQIIFRYFNKISEREMVVESQNKKLQMIRECSQLVQNSSKHEMLYYNGDMGKWSGQDIFIKFLFLIELMLKLNFIDKRIFSILKTSLLAMYRMRVLVGRVKSVAVENLTHVDPLLQSERRIKLIEESWPQGIFHNISSFVHQLEQLFRKFTFIDYLSEYKNFKLNPASWQQLVHSDDKNEIIALPTEYHMDWIKFNSYIPRLFSLITSETKDSYSRIASEMVGVLNIRSYIYDNGVKTLSLFMEPFEDLGYSQNYKYVLGRSMSYYEKTMDLMGYLAIESLSHRKLIDNYKLDPRSWKLSLSTYGRYISHPINLRKYGIYADNVSKLEMGLKVDSLNFYTSHSNFADKSISKARSNLMKKLEIMDDEVEGLYTLGSANSLEKTQYLASMRIDTLLNKLNLLRKNDKVHKLYFFKRSNDKTDFVRYQKMDLMFSGSAKDCSTSLCELLLDPMTPINTDYLESVPSYFYLNVDVVKDIRSSQTLDYKKIDIPYKSGFIETESRSMKFFKIRDQKLKITYKELIDIMNKNYLAVFRTYYAKINKDKMINEYNSVVKSFSNFRSVTDFECNRYMVESYIELHRDTNIGIFTKYEDLKSIIFDDRFLNVIQGEFHPDIKLNITYEEDKKFIELETSNPKSVIIDLKSCFNNMFIDKNFDLISNIKNIYKVSNISLSEILNYTSDFQINFFLREIVKRDVEISNIPLDIQSDQIRYIPIKRLNKVDIAEERNQRTENVDDETNYSLTLVKYRKQIVDVIYFDKRCMFDIRDRKDVIDYFQNKTKIKRFIIGSLIEKYKILKEIINDINSYLIKYSINLSIYPSLSLTVCRGMKFGGLLVKTQKNRIVVEKLNEFNQLISKFELRPYKDVPNFEKIISESAYLEFDNAAKRVRLNVNKENIDLSKREYVQNIKLIVNKPDIEPVQFIRLVKMLTKVSIKGYIRPCRDLSCFHSLEDQKQFICFSTLKFFIKDSVNGNVITNLPAPEGSIFTVEIVEYNFGEEHIDINFATFIDKLPNGTQITFLSDSSIKEFISYLIKTPNNLFNESDLESFLFLMQENNRRKIEEISHMHFINLRLHNEKSLIEVVTNRKEIKTIKQMNNLKVFENLNLCSLELDTSNYETESHLVVELITLGYLWRRLSVILTKSRYFILSNTMFKIASELKVELSHYDLIIKNISNLDDHFNNISKNFENIKIINELIKRLLTSKVSGLTVIPNVEDNQNLSKNIDKSLSFDSAKIIMFIEALDNSFKFIKNLEDILTRWQLNGDLPQIVLSFINLV